MVNEIVGAVIGGLVSGAVGGVLASRFYIRRYQTAMAQGNAISGSGNQQADGPAQMARSKSGPINQTVSLSKQGRRAELAAAVEQRIVAGLREQVLVLSNLGDTPIENLRMSDVPDRGGFSTPPDWTRAPRTLSGGRSVELPCVTRGAGLVRFVAQFESEAGSIPPTIVEATHQA